MVNRDELTETHGQIFRLNGNLFLLSVIRRDHHWLMRLALRFWQQGDKRLLQRRTMGFARSCCALPVASISPAFIATSQSKRSASSI